MRLDYCTGIPGMYIQKLSRETAARILRRVRKYEDTIVPGSTTPFCCSAMNASVETSLPTDWPVDLRLGESLNSGI